MNIKFKSAGKVVSLSVIFFLLMVCAKAQDSLLHIDTQKNILIPQSHSGLRKLRTGAYASDIGMLNNRLSNDREMRSPYWDTLALLFAEKQMFEQAMLITDKVIAKRGYSNFLMDIKAFSAVKTNNYAVAVNCYDALYKATNNRFYLDKKLKLTQR